MRFHKHYFALSLLIFLIEVAIALWVKDRWVRPYGGDTLVVILIYTFFMTFHDFHKLGLAVGVLCFAYLIETLQYFKLVSILGFEHSRLANIVIGNSFAWGDMVAYTLGFLFLIAFFKDAELK